MKLLSGLLALACVPAAFAGNNAPLPKDNVAEFVAGKLDVTTLPSSICPKPQKSKKTFSDYGYAIQQMDDKQKIVEVTTQGSQINISILVRSSRQTPDSSAIQRVLMLKLKNADGLLKGRDLEGILRLPGGRRRQLGFFSKLLRWMML